MYTPKQRGCLKVGKKLTKKDRSIKRRQYLLFYLFMAPWIIGFLLLTAWPFFYTIYLSFHSVSDTVLGWDQTFIGIENYNVALFRNPSFTAALVSFVTMQIAYVPAITVVAFILALLLNRGIKFRSAFRAIFFLPVIVMSGPVMYHLLDAGAAVATPVVGDVEQAIVTWIWLDNIIAYFSIHLANILFFLSMNFTTVLWFTGIPIILFLSALQKLDTGVLEAAKIDSATSWQILWLITVPVLRPIILVSVILTIVQIASYPLNPVLPMIQTAIFQTMNGLGLASAYAWIYSAIILLIIGVAFLLLKAPKDTVPPEVKRKAKAWNE